MSASNRNFFSSISFVRISFKIIWLKTWSWYKNPMKNEIWKGLYWYFPKDAHQKSEGGSVRSDLKKLDSKPPRLKTTSSVIFCAAGAWGLTVIFDSRSEGVELSFSLFHVIWIKRSYFRFVVTVDKYYKMCSSCKINWFGEISAELSGY